MVSPSSKMVKSLIEAIGDLYPELSVKNAPGKHSQEEHTPIIYLNGAGHEVTDMNARSTMQSASRSTESTSSGEGRVRARVKDKDYTKNAADDGKTALSKCKKIVDTRVKQINEMKKQREVLDKETSKPEFANRVMNAVKKHSDAEKTGDEDRMARARAEKEEAGNVNLEMLEQMAQLDQRISAAETVMKQEIYEVLFINNDGTSGPEMDSVHSLGKVVDGNMDNINSASNFVGRIVAPEYLSKTTPYTVMECKGSRENVSTRYTEAGPVTVMNLRPNSSDSDIAHETGHVLEDQVPSIKENAIIFWKDRTSGCEVEKIRDITGLNFDENEICKKDDFLDPYMGKIYGGSFNHMSTDHTELVSMGVEMLYTNPQKLIDGDPEMFTWLVDTLRGKNKIQPRKDDDDGY